MVDPPSDAGAVHLTTMAVLVPEAVGSSGVPGRVAGVATNEFEAEDRPDAFRAVTVIV